MSVDPPAGWQPRHRAGRNVPLAIAVGLAIGIVAVVPLLWYRPAFAVLIALAVAAAMWELVRALRHRGARPPLIPLLLGGAGTVLLTWFTGPEALVIGVFVTMIAATLWRIPDGSAGFGRDVGTAALVVVYVPLLAGFVLLLAAPDDDGPLRVIAFAVTTICSDIGGFAVGARWGRHRMSPVVSPQKSWEGLVGSLVLCVLSGVAFFVIGFSAPVWQGLLFGFAVGIAAVVGDLAESMVKRDLGVKDMGSMLPAHGGFMDRFDSLLAAAPVAYVLLSYFVPPQ